MKIFSRCVYSVSIPNQICVANKPYTQITGQEARYPYAVKLFIDCIRRHDLFREESDETLVYKFLQM